MRIGNLARKILSAGVYRAVFVTHHLPFQLEPTGHEHLQIFALKVSPQLLHHSAEDESQASFIQLLVLLFQAYPIAHLQVPLYSP